MKNIILVLSLMMIFSSCTRAQDGKLENWSLITYSYSSGPLPPPYHYSYQFNINNDGKSNLNFVLGYDNTTVLDYNFDVSKEDLKKLEEQIIHSQILTGIKALPENRHPIGGPLSQVRLVIVNPNPDLDQPPKVFETPYFPEKAFESCVNELYEFIDTLIPKSVNDDITAKKKEYEEKNKK